jgi:hypothetical protein
MKKLRIPFLSNKLGVSYSISAVIIIATTITIVLVASSYAYQILEQHKGVAEFEVAKKSILAFDDALGSVVSGGPGGSRSTRFTVRYGQLELMPRALQLIVNVTDYSGVSYSNLTGYVRYGIKTKYVNFGEPYKTFILGNESVLVGGSTESLGQAFIEQESSWVNITLNYRVRAMRTSVFQVGNDTVNYVDIMIVKINIANWLTHIGDFNLKARYSKTTIITSNVYDVTDNSCNINVKLGNEPPDEKTIELVSGKVVFNFVVAEVEVYV